MIDKQIRLRDGDRRRRWVRERMAEVGRAELAGALTPNDVALQNTRFVAGLHRDRILTEVADLVPTADELVRECLVRMPVSQREMRAGRPVDAHRIRDARRLVIAAGALAPYVLDPGLAGELRTWRRLRHAR
jgi:hypothetical protein